MVDELIVTTAVLRERLADTRMPTELTDVVMPAGTEKWPAGLREQLGRSLTPAGVLIPIIERASDPMVLLTQRAAELRHHAGQISFPGGRMERSDRDIEATALRETHEEVGIPPQAVTVIGYLDPMPTVTGFAVTPVVGLLPDSVRVDVDRTEVEFAFEVPLSFLLDRRNHRASTRSFGGRTLPIIEFVYEGRRIWGATANMLFELRKALL